MLITILNWHKCRIEVRLEVFWASGHTLIPATIALALTSYCFNRLPAFVVIGQDNYFGFGYGEAFN